MLIVSKDSQIKHHGIKYPQLEDRHGNTKQKLGYY
jgi:hypothetical protein